jgi:hypothetical protein
MNAVEKEIEQLKVQLAALEKRVRLNATAERFLNGEHEIRTGDFVRFEDGHVSRVFSISSEGKWTYFDRHGHVIEPFKIPPEPNVERLYTIEEVAEILAKATR